MKKGIFTVLMAAVLSMAAALSAYAGEWVTTDEGYKYKYKNDDGSFVGEGVVEIDGKYYLFSADGSLFAEEYWLNPFHFDDPDFQLSYFELSKYATEVMKGWCTNCFCEGVDSDTSSLIQQYGLDKVEPELHYIYHWSQLRRVTEGEFHFPIDWSHMPEGSLTTYIALAVARIGQLYPRQRWSITVPKFNKNELVITLHEVSEKRLSYEEAGWKYENGYWCYKGWG